MLIILVFLRIPEIITCYEEKQTYHILTWHINLDMVARLCAVINSSVNFIIYCCAGKQFRACLANTFRRTSGQRTTSVSVTLWQVPIKKKLAISEVIKLKAYICIWSPEWSFENGPHIIWLHPSTKHVKVSFLKVMPSPACATINDRST